MQSKSKEKIEKYDTIYLKHFDGTNVSIPYRDFPKNMRPDDTICIGSEGDFYSEDNSYGAYTELSITRTILETDEEYNERMSKLEQDEIWAKERRRESYLKLKEEFEGDHPHNTVIIHDHMFNSTSKA
jgi:hypothetical protein